MRNLKLAFISLCLLLLSSCTTVIDVNITDAKSKVIIKFTDEAKQAILENPESDQKILEILHKASGRPVSRNLSDEYITYTTDFKSNALPIELTSVSFSKTEKYSIIRFGNPTKLENALANALKNNPEKEVLTDTYKKNIVFNVSYQTKNRIVSVKDSQNKVYKHSKHGVIFNYSLANAQKGQVFIESKTDYSLLIFFIFILLLIFFIYKNKIKIKKRN